MFGHKKHNQPPPPPAGGGYPNASPPMMPQHEPTFKIFCRADEAYCLTIRHDAVVLAPTNPRDEYQHWYKDMRHSTRVSDAEGHPAFALVNKATGLAVKHSLGQSHPVKLIPYNPEYLDESVLWTESNDVGKGFRCIRMVNNLNLNFDALHGDKSHGGVHDGTGVVLWEWCKGENQSWKILPWGTDGGGYGYGYGGGSSGGQDPYAPPPTYGGGYRSPPGGAEAYPPPQTAHGAEAYAPPGSGYGYGYGGGSSGGQDPYAPPPTYGGGYRPPPGGAEAYPPPQTAHGAEAYAPPGAGYGYGYGGGSSGGQDPYAPPPAYGGGYRPPPQTAHGAEAYAPPGAGYGYGNLHRALASESTVRVLCAAGEDYSLTVRNGTVCLAPTNPRDEFQHWVKDMRYSTKIKDEEGYPAFALVNKITGEAIKHSLGQSHPVKLVGYNPEYMDESVLWTESKDVGKGFRCIRMVNNIYLNFDALHGDKDHGGVHDGTEVVLWEWCKGDNQRWKIVPW